MKQRLISRLLLVSVIAGLASVASAEIAKPKVFDIKTYGAIGDGVALNTEAIQETIDACHAAGGGMVLVPAGAFVTGTLHLKSHITLSFDYGASLLGSQNQEDYPTDKLQTVTTAKQVRRLPGGTEFAHRPAGTWLSSEVQKYLGA